MKIFVFLSLISSFLLAEPEVRVSVAPPASSFILRSDSGEKFAVEASPSGIILNGKQTGKSTLTINADLIEINSQKFRKIIDVNLKSNKLELIHTLPMESYIVGVISSEVPMSWPKEVLKAQAIAARTYAIWQMYQKDHLQSSVMDQVYFGIGREHKLAKQAVEETAGEILTYHAKPAHTYFHACCGGHTASSREAFGGNETYLKGVSCPYCRTAPIFKWKYKISHQDLNQKLNSKISRIESTDRTDSGRIQSFRFKSKPELGNMKATEFRKHIGYNKLRSTLITDYSLGRHGAEFSGQGHGHGVGMCQWGALNMAKQGKSAQEILSFYYPGTELRTFY